MELGSPPRRRSERLICKNKPKSGVANPPGKKKRASYLSAFNNLGVEMQITVKSAHPIIHFWEIPPTELPKDEDSTHWRHAVSLSVVSTYTVADLKYLLRMHPWFPPKNLGLLHHGSTTPLHIDDNNTLDECGIKDGDTLVAFMDAPFMLRIYGLHAVKSFPDKMLPVKVDSCFQTLGYLKDKVYQASGLPPSDHVFFYVYAPDINILPDETPLVALGLVAPFTDEMDTLMTLVTVTLPKFYKTRVVYSNRPDTFLQNIPKN